MADIASGIIIGWTKTSATIPSGWSRESALDNRYVEISAAGADADLTTDNGNATHNHTMAAHNHTFSGNSYTASRHPNDTTTVTVTGTHTHASKSGNNATATLSSTTNDFLRLDVVFIKSDGTPTGIPDGGVVMMISDTLPGGGWNRTNGNGYLRGSAGDGSPTQTGSNAHTHVSPNHSHSAATSNTRTGTDGLPNESVTTFLSSISHTHSVSLNNTAITFSSETVEPVFRKINMILNSTGAVSWPDKICALWGGTNASIPTNWARKTSFDGSWLKAANANGESDVTTGGTSGTHTHTQSHTHTATDAGASGTTLADDSLVARGALGAEDGHQHGWTINSNTTVSNASSSAAHYPPFRKLILIEWTAPSVIPQRALQGVGI